MGNSGVDGILLTHLSKRLDCLRHNLLVAYGFDQPLLCFIFSFTLFLSDRTKKTKVSNAYSSYIVIKNGIPQSSILGPLLCNNDICDLFLWDYKCDIASYADVSTPYTSNVSLNLVLEILEGSACDLF